MKINNFIESNKINLNTGIYCLKILNNNKIGFITNYSLKIFNLQLFKEELTIKDPLNQFLYCEQLKDGNIILSSNRSKYKLKLIFKIK